MKDFTEFQTKVNRSLNAMEAKISFLNDGVKGLSDGFKEFKEDISDFRAFPFSCWR